MPRAPGSGRWWRAAHSDSAGRTTALRFTVWITTCWAGWVILLVLSESVYLPGFLLMVAAELSVPVWAERAHATTWHPHHIAERYGLFTIIVLGETILAATAAVQDGLDAEHADDASDGLTALAVSALFVVFSMWWLYFDHPAHRFLSDTNRNAFLWDYGHYLIFSSAAAVGAGLALAVDYATHRCISAPASQTGP
ncbi:low temperature requirement protein A [Candidatus Protofrankia californiensis]|uniref:low temperature requirement protein A n=1 Tax=Candidatus Protofrankia californiensis TaxID=1839754 RepID=UPI0013EDED64|nr:low temperature requirement protein A [Candidatus Protofrankia californiensis]